MFSTQTNLPRLAVGAILAALAGFPVCAQSLQERVSACFVCHGERGQSQIPEVPSRAPSRHFIPWSSWSCFETSYASPNR
jgi:hypothetical protein